MRTIEYGAPTHVPAFLTKLWKLVTDVSCDELISWSPAGTSFIIYDEIRFSKELLPMYFKHNNMASFVRQLNMYGFRKLSCIDQGGMHCYRNEIEFYHQYFIKGQESLLELIKRKIPNSKSEEPKVKQEYIDELISNIKSLKGKSDSAEQGLKHLRRENRMLWRHVNLLADRYTKQQTVLQQLVPFFMNMVQSSREVALKRKVPLMIDEGNMPNKMPRLSPPYYVEHSDQDSSLPSSPGNVTNRGPVIHDVTELESRKMFPANILCSPNTSTKDTEAIVDSPLSCSLESSEKNIDSPYTEPGSVETLNILNHNFERSNSISPHMEMKHSPSSTATSPMHLSPSVCAMPSSTQTSGSNYSPISISRIPPVTIIDETTSDVPPVISNNLIRSSFIPKIEDTCTDSGIYSIDSMMSNRSSMMPSSSTVTKPSSSMMAEGTSTMMPEGSTTMMPEGSTTMMPKGSSTMMPEGASSHVNGSRSPMMPCRSTPKGSPSSMVTDGMMSQINEETSGNSQNKFLPNNYATSSKPPVPNMPWMQNQDLEVDSWLGQIFKFDNLVPGLSLPQK